MTYLRQNEYIKILIFLSGMVIGILLFYQFQNRDIMKNERGSEESKNEYPAREVVYAVHNFDGVFKQPTCTEPRKDIAFLKVHKCGSTTVSNILQRFGLRQDLNFVLPDKPHEKQFWVLGKVSNMKDTDIIGLPPGENYNILSVDTIFDITAYRKLVPNNAFILGIVREPVDRFISRDFYDGRGGPLVKRYKPDPYIYAHLTNTSRNEQSAVFCMAYDFGLPVSRLFNDDAILQTLRHIDKEFDFVMVMEYFDESLVLLKRRLCWTTRDIVYIKRNVHSWNERVYAVSPDNRQVIKSIQKADVVFYEHFKQKLQKEMLQYGQNFLEEVNNFKIILKLALDFCTHKSGPEELVIPDGIWNEEFEIDRDECKLMMLTEFPLVKKLQNRQYEKIKKMENVQ